MIVRFETLIVGFGVLLAVLSEYASSSPNAWYILWSAFPYGAYYLAATAARHRSYGAILAGGVLLLGVDIAIRFQVFFRPGSSTDSIALVLMPFWQSVVVMPIGFFVGWGTEKVINKAFSKR